MRGRRKKGRGGGGEGGGEGRKAGKRGKRKVAARVPYPSSPRRLLRMLSKTPRLRLTDFVFLYIHRIKVRYSEAIRWLKTPRSLSFHTLIWFITQDDKKGDSK